MVAAPVLTFGLFAAAGVLALLAVVPSRALRSGLLNVAWTVITIFIGVYLRETWFSVGTLGVAMRSDPIWISSPGMLLLAMAALVTGLSAAVSVLYAPELRRAPGIAAGVILIVLSLVVTDVFGVLTPRPELSEPSFQASKAIPGEYDVQIDLGNAGWRALQLGGDPRYVVSPATFLLQRNIGPDSWEDLTTSRLVADKLKGQLGGRATAFPNVEITGGQTLSQVASSSGTDMRTIAAANNITDPMADLTGMTITIPMV